MTATDARKRLLHRSLLLIVVLALAWTVLGRRIEMWLHPIEVTLYVSDERADARRPFDLAAIFPPMAQRRAGVHVTVSPVPGAQLIDSPAALFDAFARAELAGDTAPLRFRLHAPYAVDKKNLRAAIDGQSRFTAAQKVRLLRETYVLVGIDDAGPQGPCAQLDDDLTYIGWTFGGFGLRLDDRTAAVVARCPHVLVTALVKQATPSR